MKTLFVHDRRITYDGRQLAPHWIYRSFDDRGHANPEDDIDMRGDAAVAFIGPCQVDLSEMVDLEDIKQQAPIYSPLMLHVIAEFFAGSLHQTVYRQRLLIVTAKELLENLTERKIIREGDDLYLLRPDGQRGKLSVSIATASPTSTLIHTGFNIEIEGTPVPTVGLTELGVKDPHTFGMELLKRYACLLYTSRCV